MTTREIKHLIDLHKTTQVDIAREIGCAPDELARTISGERRNQRIRVALAAHLGFAVEVMFDADFDALMNLRKAS